MTDEKRKHQRVAVSLQVDYLERGDLSRQLVTDLSPGGLFVHTGEPLAIGTEVDLEVRIATEESPIHVRGKVVWMREVEGRPGMGIQFTGPLGPLLLEMVEEAKKG